MENLLSKIFSYVEPVGEIVALEPKLTEKSAGLYGKEGADQRSDAETVDRPDAVEYEGDHNAQKSEGRLEDKFHTVEIQMVSFGQLVTEELVELRLHVGVVQKHLAGGENEKPRMKNMILTYIVCGRSLSSTIKRSRSPA